MGVFSLSKFNKLHICDSTLFWGYYILDFLEGGFLMYLLGYLGLQVIEKPKSNIHVFSYITNIL